MELLIVVLKTIFFYFFILIIYRIMGKREIGQLSIQDLVVSILIAEMVAISIENKTDPLAYTVFPIIVLVLLEIVMAFISLKCNKIRHIIEGKPALIIDDLLLELRTNKIKNLMDVEYAVLENNGKLNIFKYNFLKIKSENPFPLILDGKVETSTLNYINKDEKWLLDLLSKDNLNVSEIFYCFYKNNKAYIIKKEDVK